MDVSSPIFAPTIDEMRAALAGDFAGKVSTATFDTLATIVAGLMPLQRTLGDVLQMAVPPASGTIVASDSTTTIMLINNASLLLALTVTLPANPINLQRFTVAANAAITVLTISGGTVRGALAGLAAGGFMTFRYSADLQLWFRTA